MKRSFFAVVVSMTLIFSSCSKSSDSSSGGGGLLSKAESALTPSDPWVEFALMMTAKSKATSWRSKMVMDQNGKTIEMDSEVMCPDKQHTKMTQGGAVTMESTMIGSTMYVNVGGRMMKTNNPMSAAMMQCGGTPSGASSSSSKPSFGSLPSVKDITSGLENIEKAKQNTQITKGGVSTVEGATCQEWNVVYNDPASKQSYTSNFCVGIADHLPRRMIMNRGGQGQIEMTYWDWNSNINIAPPAM